MPEPIIDLAAAEAPAVAGAKASRLAWLHRSGWRVPAGFVVPTAVVARDFRPGEGGPREEVRAALARVLDPGASYSVRSSALVEDGSGRTYAGQFETVLDVRGLDAVIGAVGRVAASVNSPAVAAYGAQSLAGPIDRTMAIIVQRMIPAIASGVAFSRNPLTGLDEVVVEAVPGLGDALVQDGVTPDRWIERWGNFVQQPPKPRIDEVIIREVVRETRRIASAFGGPVDLEWAHDGASLWWLQARPIVGIEGLTVYSSRIAREVLPGIIKPLVWSVNVPIVNQAWIDLFTEAVGPNDIAPGELARAFGYRAYFNMTAVGDIFVALGMPRDSLELLLGLPAGSERPRLAPTAATWRHLPRMLALALRLNRYDRSVARQMRELESAYQSIDSEDLAAMDATALLDRVARIAALTRPMAYANIVSPLLMNLYGAIVRSRTAALGLDPTSIDPAAGDPELRELDPRWALAELGAQVAALPADERAALEADGYAALRTRKTLAGLEGRFENLLRRFGHLSASSSDFSAARWSDEPDLVVRMVLARPAAPVEKASGWAAVEQRAGLIQRLLLRRLFRRAAIFRVVRERVSSVYTYGYGLFRPTFLALADRLVARGLLARADDIFYLARDEISALLADSLPRAHELVARRRAEISSARDFDMPDLIIGNSFVPRHRTSGNEKELRGVPSSAGAYRGPVRVIRSISEFDRLRDGEVLVVPYSDVAWTPLFARAGAVVAESGGMLSHSSIVAREQGIPCVVSVRGACDLAEGTIVHVDGYRGIVTVETA